MNTALGSVRERPPPRGRAFAGGIRGSTKAHISSGTNRCDNESITAQDHLMPHSKWPQTFADKRLCSALVDRLTYNGHIIETGTESYRLRTTQQRLG